MRRIEVKAYDQEWSSLYEREIGVIKRILGSNLLSIHHIGSTAVPGLQAKPIIDIMPVVKDIDEVDKCNEAMIEAGYHPRGENGIIGRRYFHKGKDNRTHHMHIYEKGSKDITRQLAFRDYLRAHPHRAAAYGSLKMELAKQYPFNVDAYIQGKSELVLEIEKEALQWSEAIGGTSND